MSLLTEAQLRKLCDDLYRDRHQIYQFDPSAAHAEVLLWTLLGSLYSLLDLSEEELAAAGAADEPDRSELAPNDPVEGYLATISRIMDHRRASQFDARAILNDLVAKVQMD